MEIADGEHVWSLGEFRTNLRPHLRPAVVSGAEEGKKLRFHVGVFNSKIFSVEVRALGEPVFELAGGFDDVHAGNDSGGENGKSNGGREQGFHKRGTETHRKPLILIFLVSFFRVSVGK